MSDGTKAGIKVIFGEDGQKGLDVTKSVVRLEIEDHDRLVDEVTVVMDDGFSLASQHIYKHQPVHVYLGYDAKPTKMFVGTVLTVSGVMDAGVAVRALDPLAKLQEEDDGGKGLQPGSKLSMIVKKVADHHQLKIAAKNGIECVPDPTFGPTELPNPVGRTDLQFLLDLARTWAARCFVEVNDNVPQFYFKSVSSLWAAEPMGTVRFCKGWGDVSEFRYEKVAAREARQLVATAADPKTGVAAEFHGVAPATVATAGGNLSPSLAGQGGVSKAHEAASAVPKPPSPNTSPAQRKGLPSEPARAAAAVVIDPTLVTGYRATATVSGDVMLRAKGRIEITGIAPWAEGYWWVCKAKHVWVRTSEKGQAPNGSYQTQLEVTR